MSGDAMDALFEHVLKMHGDRALASVLDAGTGKSSLQFVAGLPSSRWVAVTGDAGETDYLRAQLGAAMRPQDRLVMGNWADPSLLDGEVFDLVLADYLLGAVDRVAPYFQEDLLRRLRPHVGGRLCLVGLEPLPLSSADSAQAALLEVFRLADVSRLLVQERCYREYPLAWITRALPRAGFRVVDAAVFPNVYRMATVQRQVDGARKRFMRLKDPALRKALVVSLAHAVEELRAVMEHHGSVTLGQDNVVTAEPV
jgi:hypothetical protein